MKTLSEILNEVSGMEVYVTCNGECGLLEEFDFTSEDLKETYTSNVGSSCDANETSYLRYYTNSRDPKIQIGVVISKKEFLNEL